MTPAEMRKRFMSLKRKLPDNGDEDSKLEPDKKKAKLSTETKYIFSVFSCKNFYVASDYGHEDYPDKGDQKLFGVFNNLLAANKCAIHHFKRMELKRIEEERGYSEYQTKCTHDKCEGFAASWCKDCFSAIGEKSEKPLTGTEEDEHIGFWKRHVWVEKNSVQSDFIESDKDKNNDSVQG